MSKKWNTQPYVLYLSEYRLVLEGFLEFIWYANGIDIFVSLGVLKEFLINLEAQGVLEASFSLES